MRRLRWGVSLAVLGAALGVISAGPVPTAKLSDAPLTSPTRQVLKRLVIAEKDVLPMPVVKELEIYPASFPPGLDCAVAVTLDDVLKLAILSNIDIELARVAVERARINIGRTTTRFLPNLAIGSVYTLHDGTIQNTPGNISNINRDSLFVGLGSVWVAPLGEAIFAIPEARQRLQAARFGQNRVMNDTLLRVAEAYFAVLRARRQVARFDETIEFLTSEQESPLRGESKGLLPLIKAFVKAGTALPSDQARVEADVVRRMGERVRALEDVRTASAELARLLHLDASIFLYPVEDYRKPLDIPGDALSREPIEKLIAQALRSRPEIGENNALIEAALARYRAAQYRPLLPNVIANVSYGGFGGGPEIVGRTRTGANLFSNSGVIKDFGPRTDIDLGLQWRLEGLGLGNLYQVRDRRLQLQEVQLRNLFIQDAVISQVVSAVEQIRRSRERIELITAGLFDEQGRPVGTVYRSLRLNFVRIKGGQGLPLEVLDSTRRLTDVLGVYADALSDYDRARMRLLVALGLPTAQLVDLGKTSPPPADGLVPLGKVQANR
ncbi:MAG: TolC family protein [Gemmataceae bacterium]